MTLQATPVSRFTVGQRVRVRRRVTGRQYPHGGEEATLVYWEPYRARRDNGGWYLLDTRPEPRWYAPEQLEVI